MILHLLVLMYLFGKYVTQSFIEIQSPCPEAFYYEKQVELGKWYGVISIQAPEEIVGVWIKIKLDNKAEFLGNWFGETYSSDNTEFSITNSDYILEAGSSKKIRFFIQYNAITGPIPKVDTIRLNGKIICLKNYNKEKYNSTQQIGKPSLPHNQQLSNVNVEVKNNSTNITQSAKTEVISLNNIDRFNDIKETPRYVSEKNNSSNDTKKVNNIDYPKNDKFEEVLLIKKDVTEKPDMTHSPNNNFSSYIESPVSTEANSPVVTFNNTDEDFFYGDFNDNSPKKKDHSKVEKKPTDVLCGTVTSKPKALITFGQDTSPGDWPWHAALYYTKGIQIVYICGGTLISEIFILTAAHCVVRPSSNKPVDVENILVYLGKYSLQTFGPESQARDVSDIFVHQEYNYSMYFNDIALLKLSSPIEITDYVRPVCLWEESQDLRYIVGSEGTVIGWGFDENKRISAKLMQAKMPIVSTNQCIESNKEFFGRYTFQNNFCAGFRNGTSVCNGDSGGPMVFPKNGTSGQNSVWQIRGLVSVGVALQNEGVCDVSQYIVFTDAAKYVTWIRRVVNENP